MRNKLAVIADEEQQQLEQEEYQDPLSVFMYAFKILWFSLDLGLQLFWEF
jgi:hypothetical protein